MWTSGAVDMWITVAAQSPCQVPGLSPTPPGDHPAAGMRRSRRPRAARLRSAGERNGARRWPRPDRASADAPYPGCAHEPRPGPAAGPGYGELPDPVTGEPHGAEAQPAAEQRAGCGPAGTGQRAQRRGPPGGRRQVPRPECRAGGGPGAEGGRIPPARNWTGPAKTPNGRPRSARMPHRTKPERQRRPKPRSRRQRTPTPGLKPAPGTPRLTSSVPTLTKTRPPGRPVLDNPQAQPAAGAVRETQRQATTSAEHPRSARARTPTRGSAQPPISAARRAFSPTFPATQRDAVDVVRGRPRTRSV